jgi:hypothetical protein
MVCLSALFFPSAFANARLFVLFSLYEYSWRKGVTNKEYYFTVSESAPPPTKPHRGKIKGGGGTVKTGS